MMEQNKPYESKLEIIKDHVKKKWNNKKNLPPYFTLHNYTHSQKVINILKQMIPENGNEYSLSNEEKFYLSASAMLHDIGMIPNLFQKEETDYPIYDEIRKKHHERSRKYITQNFRELGLEWEEANVIADICFYHRSREDINRLDKLVEVSGRVRQQLLAAYLRLADALHFDDSRFDGDTFELYKALGMPWRTRFHWLKHRWTRKVEMDMENLKIIIKLRLSEKDEYAKIIREVIENEVSKELFSVREILIDGRISFFLKVEAQFGSFPIKPDDEKALKIVSNNLEIDRKPSASEVFSAVFEAIVYLINTSQKKTEAYKAINEYSNDIIKKILSERPCHMLVKKLYNILESNLKEENIKNTDDMNSAVDAIENGIKSLNRARKNCLEDLIMNTKKVLEGQSGNLLLFGYSKIITMSMEKALPFVNDDLEIFICECRGKNQYNCNNEIEYCDGLKYALEIQEIGYKKIYLVPDIMISNLLKHKNIKTILFGANGVDQNSGTSYHTAGHSTIAETAKEYKIPIYVVIDHFKIGDMEGNHQLERNVKWFTADRKTLAKLQQIKLYNPKEDMVEKNRIHRFITDLGIKKAEELASIIVE